jgi:hypothetical protein
MTRIPLTDGSGSWFDSDKAELIKEETRHNGSNWISRATDSEFKHEGLYRTAGGRWILEQWSDYSGSFSHYTEITNEEAAIWLAKQGLDPHPVVVAEYEALEIK